MNAIGYDERKAVYEAAIEKWGMEAQAWMIIEEMSELAKELCKARRGKNDPEALADEIADVTIMLEQARFMFGVNDLVCAHMDAKIERLRERVAKSESAFRRDKLESDTTEDPRRDTRWQCYNREAWCPLTEVKTPHGRLVDVSDEAT